MNKNTNSSILLCAFKALVFSFFCTAIYTYINLVTSTARVFGDRGGVNDRDDVHLFEKEMQWWILSAVTYKSTHITFTLNRETCPAVSLNGQYIP